MWNLEIKLIFTKYKKIRKFKFTDYFSLRGGSCAARGWDMAFGWAPDGGSNSHRWCRCCYCCCCSCCCRPRWLPPLWRSCLFFSLLLRFLAGDGVGSLFLSYCLSSSSGTRWAAFIDVLLKKYKNLINRTPKLSQGEKKAFKSFGRSSLWGKTNSSLSWGRIFFYAAKERTHSLAPHDATSGSGPAHSSTSFADPVQYKLPIWWL